ncbi:MAG: tryptophan 2,3-dioxygenase family protein, partial [Sphingomicrobium sp.]
TPVDYSAFRDVLGTSSGFQSAQFRELEFRLGIKDPKYLDYHEGGSAGHARLVAALAEPSLWDEANRALARAGFDIGAKDQEGGSSDAIAAAWTIVYRDSDRWFELYQLAEKLVDVDEALASWRHKHVLTITRIIGNKMGTGGSAGAQYLESTLSKRAFPELWSLRTSL